MNNNNKLYILGGTSDESSATKIFIVYDPIKDKMRRLPDSLYPHSKHSLFVYKDQIYAIGGDNLQCERYDINKNEYISMNTNEINNKSKKFKEKKALKMVLNPGIQRKNKNNNNN